MFENGIDFFPKINLRTRPLTGLCAKRDLIFYRGLRLHLIRAQELDGRDVRRRLALVRDWMVDGKMKIGKVLLVLLVIGANICGLASERTGE